MNIDRALLMVLIVGVFMLGAFLWFGPNECNTCKMYNADIKHGLNGIYNYNEGYFCVSVDNRKYQDINTTTFHEACHVIINKNTENNKHFCIEGVK